MKGGNPGAVIHLTLRSPMTTVHRPETARAGARPGAIATLSGLGALLSLGVLVIHVIDQQGIFALKDPTYIGVLYWVLEAAAGLAIVSLLVPSVAARLGGWTLALGVGAGPIIAFCLSRGPGLPNYTDDKGNWTEPIGVASLIVEGLLVLLSLYALSRGRRA